jgi:hypothetical protein
LAPGGRFLHPDGGIRPSRAPGSSFSPGFEPKSIRRAQANPGPPGRAWGLRTREKRKRARSVGERTRKPYNLNANPSFPPVVALSPPAPPLANPPAGCLNLAVPPPTCPHQPIFRRPACRLAIFRQQELYEIRRTDVYLSRMLAKCMKFAKLERLFVKISQKRRFPGV